ncbi:coiled-coil domain-containing protein 55 [Sarotherodon galilaeus]
MTRPAFDPADSDLFERQEAALSIWTEKLKGKQRLFAEQEHLFEGTRLALGGPRRRRVPPPAASPAPEHSPRRADVSRRAAAVPSLAGPLLAHTPSASFTGASTSPRHSGYASHLGSTEATAPEAHLFTPPASSSQRKRRSRRHKTDYSHQLPAVSPSDCLPLSSFDSSHNINNGLISDPWGTSLVDDDVDWEDFFCSASPKTAQLKTVNSDGRKTRPKPVRPVSVTHPVVISTPISQPTPTPVPAPRRRAAATQSTSAPAPVSRVGVTGVQPPPVPVPAPRPKAARTQPDLPRVSEELASPSATSPLHPPPDPAFHALALSLVRLAEVSPAQAPALLAQAIALSPSLAQSIAQPPATPTTAPSSASPTSIHPLASPLQSVVQPAPLQSVVQPAPLQSVVQPAPLQSVVQPAPLQSVVQPAPLQSVVQPAPLQSVVQPAPLQSVVQPAPLQSAPVPVSQRGRPPDLLSGRRRLPRGRPPDRLRRRRLPRGRPPELSGLSHWPRGRPPELFLLWTPSLRPGPPPPTLFWFFFLLAVGCRPLKGGVLSGFLGR